MKSAIGVRAGDLRHQVTLQTVVETRGSSGGTVQTWGNTATVWASIEPLSGRELFAAKQIDAELTTRISMRYRSGVVPKQRILWGSRVFDIRAVMSVEERNRQLDLLCVERRL